MNVYGYLNQFIGAVLSRNWQRYEKVEADFLNSEAGEMGYDAFWVQYLIPALEPEDYNWLVSQIWLRCQKLWQQEKP